MAKRLAALSTLLILTVSGPANALSSTPLARYHEPATERAIAAIAHQAIQAHLAGRPYAPAATTPALAAPGGAFVTVSRDGYTRGCWGTVHPTQRNLATEVAVNAVKALSYDYRQRPIGPREVAQLVAHVSVIGPLTPIPHIQALQPRRYGLLVSAPGKGGVLLPGEALTATWALATCRRKAGLGPRERVSMYRFETAVVGPIRLSPEE